MKCQPIITGDQWTCQRCGHSARTKQTDPARIHRNCNGPLGLGDRVAAVLSRFKVRKCGGCKKRQAWLNWIWPG